MASGPQTRCAGCGRFIVARADWDDWQAEERAYVADVTEDHECALDWQADAAWSPRAGEHDAGL